MSVTRLGMLLLNKGRGIHALCDITKGQISTTVCFSVQLLREEQANKVKNGLFSRELIDRQQTHTIVGKHCISGFGIIWDLLQKTNTGHRPK